MRPRTSAQIAVLVALGVGLAGCSELSRLDHPGAGQATSQTQTRQGANPNYPTGTIDPRNSSATPAPPRTLPIPGSGQNPTASAPQGALPDPYANPPR